MSELKKTLKHQALALLSRREHAETELKQKLQRKLPPEVSGAAALLDELVEELVQADYLSNARYIDMVLRSRVDRGYGEQRIRQELKQVGLSGEQVHLQFEAHDVDWFSLARNVRDKRFGLGSVEHDAKLKARQMRFLFGRGFSSDQVSYAMSVSIE